MVHSTKYTKQKNYIDNKPTINKKCFLKVAKMI
jgi:hypothetical protein